MEINEICVTENYGNVEFVQSDVLTSITCYVLLA